MGVVIWVNPLKKKICEKDIFSDNVEWSSKNLWKMICAGVKANNKQQEIQDLVTVPILQIFIRSTFKTSITM